MSSEARPMRDLPEFRLEAYFSRWEFEAKYHLTASDAESWTVGELLDLAGPDARAELEGLALGYTPTWGTDALRAAIADTYNFVSPEHVLVFAGAQEALYWALQELLAPGDHAIVTVPNYQSLESIPLAVGAAVDGLALRAEDGWALDLDALEALLKPETRVIAVNFPNNPTGAVPDAEAFRRLAEICDERGIVLFSDEVYRGLEQDPARTLRQAADLSARAVSLNVMSKAYGLPGLRIGWLACRDHGLLERLERRKHYTSICSAGPSEHLATLALHHRDALLTRNRGIVADNLPRFAAFFARFADRFEWTPPQGGCVAFPRLTTGEPASAFCRRLVEEAGVLLLPADVYASDLAPVPEDRFRIGVGRRDPDAALAAFADFLE
ncbi:MAG TPA: aminotransferase class I/II-fold pyridoxal phosphate-dependent enzyme [Baekduia sp.]